MLRNFRPDYLNVETDFGFLSVGFHCSVQVIEDYANLWISVVYIASGFGVVIL